MKLTLVQLLSTFVLIMSFALSHADPADDACRQMVADRNVTPDMFAMMCTNKSDLAEVCVNQVKRMGPESTDNYVVRFFITPTALCKDKKSLQAFCTFVTSYDGYQILAIDAALVPDSSDPDYANLTHPRDRATKVCGTTAEAVHANLCSKADQSKQWQFAYAECPMEGKQIFIRECLKPKVSDGEGAGRVIHETLAECTSQYESIRRMKH